MTAAVAERPLTDLDRLALEAYGRGTDLPVIAAMTGLPVERVSNAISLLCGGRRTVAAEMADRARTAAKPRRNRHRTPVTPAVRQATGESLTDRERDVLRLIDRTDAQIGTELGLSPNTVGSHVRTLFRKLGATNRAGAVIVAVRAGLFAPAAPLADYPAYWCKGCHWSGPDDHHRRREGCAVRPVVMRVYEPAVTL